MRALPTALSLIALSVSVAAESVPKTSGDWLSLATKQAQSISDDRERTTYLIGVAELHVLAKEPNEVPKLLAQVILNVEAQKEPILAAMLLTKVARIQAGMKDQSACTETLKRAEAKSADLPPEQADGILGQIAAVHLLVSDNPSADRIASKIAVKHTWAEWVNSIAREQVNRGELDRALKSIK